VKLSPIKSRKDIRLDDADAVPRRMSKKGEKLDRATEKQVERVGELQRALYADGRFAVLAIFQGRDASGKDGTVKHVFREVTPQGLFVRGFKTPTDEERRHDFLWRIHAKVPERGTIGIFSRSHYEDVIVPHVHHHLSRKGLAVRYRQINDFERMLTDNNVVLLKFLLHMSRDEQERQLIERLEDPTKNWKFREDDLDDRDRWDDFTAAFRDMLANTSTKWARWFVVPADDKDARDFLVARRVADTLKALPLEYPKANPAMIKRALKRLESS
jgi:PPK2 family polyphosphate:nucleotide phosphotransferase